MKDVVSGSIQGRCMHICETNLRERYNTIYNTKLIYNAPECLVIRRFAGAESGVTL